MKGYIGTRQKCPVCQGKLKHDEKRKGCFCAIHPDIGATSFYVKFGKEIYRRFKDYDAASRFLTGIRFKNDEGTFDKRDYKKENPLGFENLSKSWIEYKAETGINRKTLQYLTSFIERAAQKWGNRNIKEISDGDIEDLIFDKHWITPQGNKPSLKTRNNMKSCLHDFWSWAVKREKRNGKHLLSMPEFPTINYELGWRNITDLKTQAKILDEIKKISWSVNPKIWLGIKMLSTYLNVRPGELRRIKERDINLESSIIVIKKPKEKMHGQGKYIYLVDEDIELIRSMPKGLPHLFFFRHLPGFSGIKAGSQFGLKYFSKWWDRACKNLGIGGVSLYAGTRHTTATALGKVLTPEEIKRGGTGSKTNKAFDRYFQPQKRERIRVIAEIEKLRNEARGELIDLYYKKKN